MNAVVDSTVFDQVSVGQLRQQWQRDSGLQHLIRVTTQFRHQIAQPAGQPRAVARRVVCRLPQLVQLAHQPASSVNLVKHRRRLNVKKLFFFSVELT